MNKKFLIIQTAFTGDVILATAMVEKLASVFPGLEIDILVRKGNESLLGGNPHIKKVLVWNKKSGKYNNLFSLLKEIRKTKYDQLINLQRFASTGIFTALSKAKTTRGFDKNPLSFLYDVKIKHDTKNELHEIDRNQLLIEDLCGTEPATPRLYPSQVDFSRVAIYKKKKYITIAPGSVWFTKTFPAYKWIEWITLFAQRNDDYHIYLLGASNEEMLCENIRQKFPDRNVFNLAGELSLLQSAALIKDAEMNYANDSAPIHLASAMNAPVTAIYCSTVPSFGFGPLSTISRIVETKVKLDCRPCGLHGYKKCPVGNFNCAHTVDVEELWY